MLIIVTKAMNGSAPEYLGNLFCITDNVNNLREMNTVKFVNATTYGLKTESCNPRWSNCYSYSFLSPCMCISLCNCRNHCNHLSSCPCIIILCDSVTQPLQPSVPLWVYNFTWLSYPMQPPVLHSVYISIGLSRPVQPPLTLSMHNQFCVTRNPTFRV